MLMDVGADGEVMRVSDSSWRDPFAEPLSADNCSYVKRVGRWEAFDVTSEPPYKVLRGHPILAVESEPLPSGGLRAVTLRSAIAVARIEVVADEVKMTLTTR